MVKVDQANCHVSHMWRIGRTAGNKTSHCGKQDSVFDTDRIASSHLPLSTGSWQHCYWLCPPVTKSSLQCFWDCDTLWYRMSRTLAQLASQLKQKLTCRLIRCMRCQHIVCADSFLIVIPYFNLKLVLVRLVVSALKEWAVMTEELKLWWDNDQTLYPCMKGSTFRHPCMKKTPREGKCLK